MADENTNQPTKPSFERDLDARPDPFTERIKKAQERFQQSQAPLMPADEPVKPVIVGSAPSPFEPAAAPAALPDPDGIPEVPAVPAVAPEPAPAAPVVPPVAPVPPPPAAAAPEGVAAPPEAAPAPAQAQPKPEQDPEITRLQIERRKAEREARRARREADEAKKAIEAARAATPPVETPAATPEVVPSVDDPLDLRKLVTPELTAIRERQEALERQARDAELRLRLDREESAFRGRQPAYDDAIRYMVDMERNRYLRSGSAALDAQTLLSDGANGPLSRQLGFNLEAEIEARADRFNITDAAAAQLLATDLWIGQQRNRMIQGAILQNRPIPELVWETAEAMGFRAAAPAPANVPAAPQPGASPAPAAPNVADKIRQQARVTAATRSLNNVAGSPGEGTPAEPQSLADLQRLRAEDPAAYRAYVRQKSLQDPNWHRNLRA